MNDRDNYIFRQGVKEEISGDLIVIHVNCWK